MLQYIAMFNILIFFIRGIVLNCSNVSIYCNIVASLVCVYICTCVYVCVCVCVYMCVCMCDIDIN